MSLTTADVREALATIVDPESGKDLVTLGLVQDIKLGGDAVRVVLGLPSAATSRRDQIRGLVEEAVTRRANALGVELSIVEVDVVAPPPAASGNPLPHVAHVLAVGAGKGGVGKSTVSVALAVGLAREGYRVGLLDADIYGPSAPTMLGLDHVGTAAKGNMLVPFEVHGIKAITMGKLVDPDKALIWRGPMAHGAFKQLALQTEWGELEYLVVDLPPGTGDVPLSLAQLLPLRGAVVVCTPQQVAQDDARRAVRMFQQLGVEVLGVVENMSYFVGDDGKEYDLFGRGGAEIMAQTMGLPCLGCLPILPHIRRSCDAGVPTELWSDPTCAERLQELVRNVIAQTTRKAGSTSKPSMSIR